MASFANWNNYADQWNINVDLPNSENLEDRFWAAFNLPFEDDMPPPGEQRKLSYNTAETLSSIAPMKTKLLPLVSQNDFIPIYSTEPPQRDIKTAFEGPRPHRQEHRKHCGSLRLQVPSTTFAASVTLSPATAIPRSPFTPSPVQNQWHLPTPGGFKPSTPTLQLVGNFLDNIVRLSDSRSTTPAATVSINEDGDTVIVESEVLIQVVEDMSRSAFDSPVDLWKVDSFAKLQIPSPLLAASGGSGYDISSVIVANGPAGCAQELDALSWMNWDRQLSNVQHLLWH